MTDRTCQYIGRPQPGAPHIKDDPCGKPAVWEIWPHKADACTTHVGFMLEDDSRVLRIKGPRTMGGDAGLQRMR